MGGHFDLLQCSRNASSNAPMPPCSRTTTETSFWSKRYRLESASAADLRKPQLSPVPLTALTTAWMPPTLQSTAQEVLEVLEVLEVEEKGEGGGGFSGGGGGGGGGGYGAGAGAGARGCAAPAEHGAGRVGLRE